MPQSSLDAWTKADLINRLAELRGYKSYLEVCTPTTGGRFAEIDRTRFPICHRLMYRCPKDFTDGMGVDYRSETLDYSHSLEEIRQRRLRYDILLVDSWHEYDTSRRDLVEAVGLLAARGTIVVHDCLPPAGVSVSPTFAPGDWCGLTYKAYVDFVNSSYRIEHQTVDMDCGCGIIRRRRIAPLLRLWLGGRDALVRSWAGIGDNLDDAFKFFEENKRALCNVVTLEEFLQEEGRPGS